MLQEQEAYENEEGGPAATGGRANCRRQACARAGPHLHVGLGAAWMLADAPPPAYRGLRGLEGVLTARVRTAGCSRMAPRRVKEAS